MGESVLIDTMDIFDLSSGCFKVDLLCMHWLLSP